MEDLEIVPKPDVELSDRSEEFAMFVAELMYEQYAHDLDAEDTHDLEEEFGAEEVKEVIYETMRESIHKRSPSVEEMDQIEAILSSDIGSKLIPILGDSAISSFSVFEQLVRHLYNADRITGGISR